ncbi:MAG: hypothetical protein ABSA46_04650 [Thermodesulfovibrionales bacterium]|jgi:hypothetical protein
MTRREFLGFFLFGGFFSLLVKTLKGENKLKKARFWEKADEV